MYNKLTFEDKIKIVQIQDISFAKKIMYLYNNKEYKSAEAILNIKIKELKNCNAI